MPRKRSHRTPAVKLKGPKLERGARLVTGSMASSCFNEFLYVSQLKQVLDEEAYSAGRILTQASRHLRADVNSPEAR